MPHNQRFVKQSWNECLKVSLTLLFEFTGYISRFTMPVENSSILLWIRYFAKTFNLELAESTRS